MSDAPEPQTPSSKVGTRHNVSPPPSPPSPDPAESENKLSRKREREASLEPVTTPKAIVDSDAREPRERRSPAKRGRTLDSTAEEEDGVSRSRSNSGSPLGISASPPQEMKIKVRQISQGVEDFKWKDIKARNADAAKDIDIDEEPPVADDSGETNGVPIDTDVQPTEPTTDGKVHEDSTPPLSATAIDPAPPTSADDTAPPPATTGSSNHLSAEPNLRRDSDSDSSEKEKGLKRKFLERGTSQGPQENGPESSSETLKRARDDAGNDVNPRETKRPSPPPEADKASEPLKRPRDDADKDANPREAKRPSPPPEKDTPAAPPKFGGFMAYASTSSPFASVKGQNVFSSSSERASPFPSVAPSPALSAASSFSAVLGESSKSSTATSTPVKRSGFEAFASTSSPFATAARAKSPVLGSSSKLGRPKSPSRRATPGSANAFSAYMSSGAQSFALPSHKRARADSPAGSSSRGSLERTPAASVFGGDPVDSGAEDEADDRPTTFGEKLRAGKDEEEEVNSEEDQSKVALTEQELTTGEEEEETIHQVRGKLYALEESAWKEKGTGLLKLNVRASDGAGARLVMRKEAVYAVLLNVTLFRGMRCVLAQDPRYMRFSVIEAGVTTHYNLRLANAKISKELLEAIHQNLPSV